MSITDMFEKIKGKAGIDSSTLVFFLVIIGVGISAFGLGRLSVTESTKGEEGDIVIKDTRDSLQIVPESKSKSMSNAKATSVLNNQLQGGLPAGEAGNYVASKNGKLYYTRGCKAANRIKPENEVWFMTASEAEKLGYTRSASCK